MAWNIINANWEYSDTPNTDKKSIDSYDYDVNTDHINGIISTVGDLNHYVLARQRFHPHPGYGEVVKVYVPSGVELLTNGDNEAGLFVLDAAEDFVNSISREQSTEQVHSGTYSAKMIGSGSYYYAIKDSNESVLTNGNIVTFSGYVYIPSGQLMDQIGLYDMDAGTYLEKINTLDTWVYFEHNITVSSDFELWFMGQSADTNEYFFVDDISLTG